MKYFRNYSPIAFSFTHYSTKSAKKRKSVFNKREIFSIFLIHCHTCFFPPFRQSYFFSVYFSRLFKIIFPAKNFAGWTAKKIPRERWNFRGFFISSLTQKKREKKRKCVKLKKYVRKILFFVILPKNPEEFLSLSHIFNKFYIYIFLLTLYTHFSSFFIFFCVPFRANTTRKNLHKIIHTMCE